MTTSTIMDRRTLAFLLYDWLRIETLFDRARYAHLDRTTADAILDLAEKIPEQDFLPAWKPSDVEEPDLLDDRVKTHPGIATAVQTYAGSGLFAAPFSESDGGMQLPQLLNSAALGMGMSANISASAFPMLTMANARLIANFGSEEQQSQFVHPMISGQTLGTMCLSEPHAGSSLADIKTVALPDGTSALGDRFRLRGNKMWISGGDQDITENIVHLVLAKTTDASGRALPGVRGISLFIVPKILPSGDRNDVVVAGLNHKMGYRGIPNCLLNFGEGKFSPGGKSGAIGYLVGEIGQGLAQMFQMMNEARISVGLGAIMLGYRSHLLSVQYASERTQGRGPDGKSTVIINHSDVRRMLLSQKAYVEGGLALVLYCASLVDDELTDTDKDNASALLGLLTPIAKTWPSEYGLKANDLAIQIHGGYGYTRDFDVEQLYRDNRLNPIHEGTTGIQALDLLGRKLLRDGGHALKILRIRIDRTSSQARSMPEISAYADQLTEIWDRIEDICLHLMADDTSDLRHATPFLRAFGHAVVAWLWLDLVCCLVTETDGQSAFAKGKRLACQFFFEEELPLSHTWLDIVEAASNVLDEATASVF